jgi:putative DNA primase/helicase
VSKFAPLTQQELDVSRALKRQGSDDGGFEIVAPVPDNAPPIPAKHWEHGKPSARWEYRDTIGRPLFFVCRFDSSDKQKEFSPLTLWRSAPGAMRWLWKAYPARRPLYSLDMLAARPDAPVLVCEGEKSADAAARLFPDFVTTTSPGGCKAAAKADWTPLAGRTVTIWPDADEPGSIYAAKVASMLQGLGCQVSLIDAMALPAIAPDGGTREVE